jgi:hypothetical protein
MTHSPGFQPLAEDQPPLTPARLTAIIGHLTRDREQGTLSMKGRDLFDFVRTSTVGDPLRDWVLEKIDARITATVEARLGGAKITDRHVCQVCFGKGMDYHKELCQPCGGIGLVCPMCLGSRWTTDSRPEHHADRPHLTACPGCMTSTPVGYLYDHAKAQRTIQAHINRPYVPTLNVRDQDIEDAYTRAEATAKERRERGPEPLKQRHARHARRIATYPEADLATSMLERMPIVTLGDVKHVFGSRNKPGK